MKRVIVATKNIKKLSEIKQILQNYSFEIVSLDDISLDVDVEETGETYDENSLLKAQEIYNLTQDIVIADDSGLSVDYLDGAPGVYSARYAGKNASDKDRINKLLKNLEDVPMNKRSARFVCPVSVVYGKDKHFTVNGTCEGLILKEPVGENGFGYDPVFFIPTLNKSMAQLTADEKNSISHRANALKNMVEKFKKLEI